MNKLTCVLLFTVILFSCDSFKNNKVIYLENTFELYTEIVRERKINLINIKPKFIRENSLKDDKITSFISEKNLLNSLKESHTIDQNQIISFWKMNSKIVSQDSIKVYEKTNKALYDREGYYEVSNPVFDSKKEYAIIEISYNCGEYYCS